MELTKEGYEKHLDNSISVFKPNLSEEDKALIEEARRFG